MFPLNIKIRISESEAHHHKTDSFAPNLGNPLFINAFTTLYFSFLVINATVSTWLKRLELMSKLCLFYKSSFSTYARSWE